MNTELSVVPPWFPSGMEALRRALARSLRWACGSATAAVLLAGCGGGGDGALSSEAQVQRDQTAAMTQAQQSVSALLAAAVQPGSGTENFEAGMGDWLNWGNAQVVAGAGVSGTNALQIGPGAGGAALEVPGVVGGTTYRWTAQARVTDPARGPTTMGVNFYDASGHFQVTRALPNVTATSLAPFTYDVEAPAGAVRAIAWVWKDGNTGYAYIDDVSFGSTTPLPPPPPPPAGANLVSNEGFESGMTGWTDWGNSRVVFGQANSAAFALSVGTAAGGAGQTVQGIVPGTTYHLRVSARVSDASDIVFVGVNLLDTAGSVVGSTQLSTQSTTYNVLAADIIAPPNAATAVVYVWKNGGSGLAYVDDYVLTAVSGSEPPLVQVSPNLIVNGEFNGGLSGWMDWGNTGISGSRATIAQVGTGAGGVGQTVAGIVAGATYRLTAAVSVSTAGETGYLGLKFMDGAGNVLQDQILPFSSTAVSTAQVQLVAPANTTTALVYVWKNAGSGLALFDDVVLVQMGATAPPPPVVQLSGTVEQRLDTDGFRSHVGQSIARLGNATYVAAWVSFGDPQSASGAPQVCFQRLTSNLARLGVNVCLPDAQATSDPTTVLPRADGGFVLVWWVRAGQSGSTIVYAQRSQGYDAAGNAGGTPQDGPQQPVRTTAAALAGGGYVDILATVLNDPPRDVSNLSFQRYAADGTPIGSPTSVGDLGGLPGARVVALAGGGFAVAWSGPGPADLLCTRTFTADGTPVGAPVLVGGDPLYCNAPPGCTFQDLRDLSPMDDGGYLVVWRNGFGVGGITRGTFARRFGPDGRPGAAVGKLGDDLLRGGAAADGPDGFIYVFKRDFLDSLGNSAGSQTSVRWYDATPLR